MGTPASSTSASWAKLPEEIIQTLGTYLNAQSWAAARTTCRSWRSITGGITLLEIDLERDAHRWMMVMTSVAHMFPRLNSITLLIGSRITPEAFTERMTSLAITEIKVQELELRFIYGSNPLLGRWLHDFSAVTQLQHLKALRLAGGTTPPVEFFSNLRRLQHLATLEVLPGVYGQMHELDVDLVNASLHTLGDEDAGLTEEHLEAIAALPNIKNLTVKVSPGEFSPSGLLALSHHGLLSSLEQLCLYESELPSSCLADGLRGANRLTHLQLGLSDVENLAPLAALRSIKTLHLDGVHLPGARDLVYAAALGNISQKGPGSITGLCLVDQIISSSLQLSSLSMLSSLSELVLMHPIATRNQIPNDDEDDVEDDDAFDPTAPPQQQPVVLDLACLSGLTGLRLLQIDLSPVSTDPEAVTLCPPPLHLKVSAAALQQLAGAWKNLVTLDLNGFTPELLPDAAIAGFSKFPALKHLSLLNLKDDQLVYYPDADGQQEMAAAAAGGGGSADSGPQSMIRRVGWWQLPSGLVSLCLSHFDLTCGVPESSHVVSNIISSSIVDGAAPQQGGPQPQTHQQQTLIGPADSAATAPCAATDASTKGFTVSPCGSSCCLAIPPQDRKQESVSDSGATKLQSYISPRLLRTKGLVGCRRNSGGLESPGASADSAQHHTDAASPAEKQTNSSSSSSSGRQKSQLSTPAAAATTTQLQKSCSCALRVSSQFSSLMSLWLEHCTLPRNFLPLLLPSLNSSLESLALLHVSGTSPDDLRLVSGLTSLTSLRLIPAGHGLSGLSGLSGLIPLKHLKRLTVRPYHLQASDMVVLPQLSRLYCLTLYAPTPAELVHAAAAGCGLREVTAIVSANLPHCDVEVQR